MQKKYTAFTLIEIMLVLLIIGILFTIVFSFGTQRIAKLTYQSAKEKLIDQYETFYSSVMRSNFVQGKRYTYMDVEIKSGAQEFSVQYDISGYVLLPRTDRLMQIADVKLSGLQADIKDLVTIRFEPYTLGCGIAVGESVKTGNFTVNFSYVGIKQPYKYCFSIQSDRCMIREEKCE